MRRHIIAFTAACLAFCGTAGTVAKERMSEVPALQPVACPIELPAELASRISCGKVAVPRDYARPEAGSFELMVLVGRAATPTPGAAPVYFAGGGWSPSIINDTPGIMRGIATTRDVVLFDKRGAGFSEPEICPPTMVEAQIAAVAADLPLSAMLPALRTALRNCREDMRRRKLDPAWFNVRTTSRDLDQVRRVLGHDRIMLFGRSNGARQVLDYLAAYPQHAAAAVVDSPALPDAYTPRASASYDRSLKLTFTACAADAACAARFPDLPGLYREAIAGLERQGLAIPDAKAPGGALIMNSADFEMLLHLMLYSRQGIAAVPAAIEAVAKRKTAFLTPMVGIALSGMRSNREITGHVQECRDLPSLQDAPPVTRGSDIVHLDGVCNFWSKPGEPSRLPENSSVPVLLLSGRFDPITPPANARIAAAAIGSKARLVEMQQTGHGAAYTRCVVREMIPAFLDHPEAALPDCTSSETPIAFLVPPG